jgi:glycyl-tRNA synthetase
MNATQEKATTEGSLKKVISHAKEYGFVFPSSEIYDGLSAVYDYGPFGVELKNNIKALWWKTMTQLNENIVGLDSSIFMHPTTWKASGHVDGFSDPMIDNKDSKKRYRADVLIEEHAATLDKEAGLALEKELARLLESEDLKGVLDLIVREKIVCPISKTSNWTDVRQFNLMFSTQVGSVAEDSSTIYLRPETAQGIFVNFLNVQKSARMKVPFGIAQIGKAFRNEIVARQFIFRMREFEQMEMQFFVRPGEELKWYQHWKEARMSWHKALGTPENKLRFHDHEKLAHYANAAVDIEFEFPFGFKEVEGIHSRTDFDLKSHQEYSGKKQQYFDAEINQNYIPFVVETSVGADRLFLMTLCNAYTEETVGEGDQQKERTYLKLHPSVAPIKAAIFPITKKDGLPEKAREIYNDLRLDLNVIYEEKDNIGKRYTRQDLIGTPFCIAVDYQSLEDNTVTLRYRDSTEQERISIKDLKAKIVAETSFNTVLSQL